ncbi:hypothetical protein PGT21_013785 [Puccinia graminis f. sp. tritici]|uniref:Uncharacterized protein n=2 Tax=Puccinia graminis f. sp. tritici TaxID=56615 RepID=E3JYF8_PUCGT|nr:uncharacterized protein PGTG_03039 [Puccinia graminis f. sp. tritici CRL 75-36-700-3]EFP77083.1 hypothetical protein PGTG_03039 [Puccinia graminis f. sp. tritici CRL 75-36-700-3]KAA1097137.1 hypothetical protein PGTUg99_004252 [Puccinia graminis f. sp. tritici]KAA1114563.1 hypothetical protein PGT21_013785 [Puccinia graminis f. sp. tritici]
MIASYTTWYLCFSLYSFGTLLQITSGQPVDQALIDQSKRENSPVTKFLNHKKRSLDDSFPTQLFGEWRGGLVDAARLASESSSVKDGESLEYAFIDQAKRDSISVTKFMDSERRSLSDNSPGQHLNLDEKANVEDNSLSAGEEKPLEYAFIDQSQRESASITKFPDQERRSFSSIFPTEQLVLWRRNLGDTAKLGGVTMSARDGEKRMRQEYKIKKAQKQWSERKHGCSTLDETCIEITNEGTITYTK